MTTRRTPTQSLIRVLTVTAAILAIPLVANQFIAGEGWSLFDFLFAGVLIMTMGLLYEWGARNLDGWASGVATAALGAIGGAAMVLGEVDDAPGLILIGMAFVIGAVVIGMKASGRRAGGQANATGSA